MTLISMIAAVGKNLELGAANQMMWHLPDDFKWFVKHTKGKPIIMGRKTMESLKKTLKDRINIVLTSKESVLDGFEKVPHIEDALALAKSSQVSEMMVIGGGEIYRAFLPLCHKIYLTRVHGEFPQADTFFPSFEHLPFQKTFTEMHGKDEKHAYEMEFEIWERIDKYSNKS